MANLDKHTHTRQPSQRLIRAFRRRWWFGALAFALGVSLMCACWLNRHVSASRATSTPSGRQTGLASALNPDGTLRSDARGSFDTSGFRLALTVTGAPRFVPMSVCSGWDTQFSWPNGVSGVVRALAVSGTDMYIGGSFVLA